MSEQAPAKRIALATFVERSSLATHRSARFYREATDWLFRVLGRPPLITDLTKENVALVSRAIDEHGFSQHRSLRLRNALRNIAAHAHRLGLLAEPVSPTHNKLPPLPETLPTTVRGFFQQVYRPQRNVSGLNLRDMRTTMRRLDQFAGDVELSQLTDELAADFFAWLKDRKLQAPTINRYRAHLFSIWRMAAEHGLVGTRPRVRKLPVALDEPDAWSEEEIGRIIDAPLTMRWGLSSGKGQQVSGIDRGRYFHAILLVVYWTGLRAGTLLKLKRQDCDLETGWLSARGKDMKNRRGKRYRLGPDAIEAVRQIWLPERELLFPWPHRPYWFHQQIRRIMEAAGVTSSRATMTRLHKLRRTFATLIAAKKGVAAASEMLGHSNLDVTLRYIDPNKMPGNDMTEVLPRLSGQRSTHLAEPRELLAGGYSVAAAMTARAELERWLRDRCQARGCHPSNGGQGLHAHARALVDVGELPPAAFVEIRRIAKTVNRAAHGHRVDGRQVENVLAVLDGIFCAK